MPFTDFVTKMEWKTDKGEFKFESPCLSFLCYGQEGTSNLKDDNLYYIALSLKGTLDQNPTWKRDFDLIVRLMYTNLRMKVSFHRFVFPMYGTTNLKHVISKALEEDRLIFSPTISYQMLLLMVSVIRYAGESWVCLDLYKKLQRRMKLKDRLDKAKLFIISSSFKSYIRDKYKINTHDGHSLFVPSCTNRLTLSGLNKLNDRIRKELGRPSLNSFNIGGCPIPYETFVHDVMNGTRDDSYRFTVMDACPNDNLSVEQVEAVARKFL